MVPFTRFAVVVFKRSNQSKNSLRIHAPLLRRVLSFIAIFVVISGFIGSRIVGHGLVDKYGFSIYGWAGKALLFGAVSFFIITFKKTDESLKLSKWRKSNLAWLALSALLGIISWFGVNNLIAHHNTLSWAVLTNLAMVVSILCAAIGCLSFGDIRRIGSVYRRELLLAVALAVGFTGFLAGAYELWQPLSTSVMHVSRLLLLLVGIHASIIPPDTMLLSKFGIMVSKYCSGVDSIALFTGLYVLVGLLDWKWLRHGRYLGLFVPALVLLFVCNILRVAGLIAAGFYINPHIAFSLFHTYAGMVFFIVYSALFWGVSYRWMLAVDTSRAQPAIKAGK